jgi:murein DD-endopeptidase MepM/ murein hydrolase activator NlpD
MDSIGQKKENGQIFTIHQIDKGQTLSAIAKKYQVSAAKIIEINKIQPDKIQAGQKLLIPRVNSSNTSTIVEKPEKVESAKISTPPKPSESIYKPISKPTTTPAKLDVKLKPTTKKGLVGLGKSDVLDPISFTALHPSLPVQSLVKVVNPENGRLVFVRIVGKTTSEMGIYDLVVSQSALDQLRILGEKLQADLTYGIAE